MPETLLYFLAGAGAVTLVILTVSLIQAWRKADAVSQVELSIKNLRRQCSLLEQMCDLNKSTDGKIMRSITELAAVAKMMEENLQGLNKKMSKVWPVAMYWHDEPKETGPDG